MDRLLDRLVGRSLRRGLRGEPLWLAVAAAAWLVRRSRRPDPVVWSGRIKPGDRLVISTAASRGRLPTDLAGVEAPGA